MRKSSVQWMEENFQMDYGLFDRRRHPPIEPILNTLDQRRGVKVMILGDAQSFKTLTATGWVLSAAALRRMKIGWYSKSDESVKDWGSEKLNPTMEAIPMLDRIRVGKKYLIDRKNFAHSFILLLSASTQIDRQQKSLQVVVLDECWTYEPGAVKEIENRLLASLDQSLEILPSTGGDVGTECEKIWKESTQQLWHVPCPECDEYFPLEFFPPRAIPVAEKSPDDNKGSVIDVEGVELWQGWGGMHFETGDSVRRPGGGMDWPALYRTVRYQCPHCGEMIEYTADRLAKMDSRGKFIQTNPYAKRDTIAFHANALRHHSWPKLAEEYLEAVHAKNHGDTEPFIVFWKTRLAKFFDPAYLINQEATGDNYGNYEIGESYEWPEAYVRIMTVDVQQTHYWVVIREWAADAESRLVWAGQCLSEGHIKQQKERYGIKDYGGDIRRNEEAGCYELPKGCGLFFDGNYETAQVRRMAASLHGVVLRGVDSSRFLHPDGKYRIYDQIRAIEAFEGMVSSGDRYVPEIQFANNDARNSLQTLRGIAKPKMLWTYPKNINEACGDYLSHLRAWIRQPKKRSNGSIVFEWHKVAKRDDLFWCEKAQVVAAAMAGLIGAEATMTTVEVDSGPDVNGGQQQ